MSIVEFEIKNPKKKLEFYEQLHKENITRIENLRKENEKLKGVIETYEILIKANNINNWNELKRWLKETGKISLEQDNRIGYNFTTIVLDEMQKLEGGSNE